MAESMLVVVLLATSIGIIAGLRTMMALAAVSWAASFGWLDLGGTALAFVGFTWTPWILSAMAAVELMTDQLSSTPSRTVPVQFGARLGSGALAGAAIGAAADMLTIGAVAGIVGAIIGTLGGRAARARLASAFRKDPPAALTEDAVAIIGAFLVVWVARA